MTANGGYRILCNIAFLRIATQPVRLVLPFIDLAKAKFAGVVVADQDEVHALGFQGRQIGLTDPLQRNREPRTPTGGKDG
jgi:hypothetical protein